MFRDDARLIEPNLALLQNNRTQQRNEQNTRNHRKKGEKYNPKRRKNI